MKTKKLVALNNEYREKLTPENKKYYENLLVYIRLNCTKSEQETEEILFEILEHLLEAQKEGKSPEEIFGDDPKAYADEIIGEIPKAVIREQFKSVTGAILTFLGSGALSAGVIYLIINLFKDQYTTFSFVLGSGIVKTIIDILIAYIAILVIFKLIRATVFKNQKKWIQLLQVYSTFLISIGLFLIPLFLIPTFGPIITLPIWTLIPAGGILLLAGLLINR